MNMNKIAFNSISTDILNAKGTTERDAIVAEGRNIVYDYNARAVNALNTARGKLATAARILTDKGYKELNEKFCQEAPLYAARMACAQIGTPAPKTYEEFKKSAMTYMNNSTFYATLMGLYQEVLTPIIPATYSEAVDLFADTVEVGFGETAMVSIASNDIPVFQDSAWGASLSAPHNTFYNKDYVLNPMPRTAEIDMKYMQVIGIGMDFGVFAANLMAGLYAKTMGMWNQTLNAAISNPKLQPTSLNFTFSSVNWNTGKKLIGGLNNTTNIVAYGNDVALGKVLPTQATGSTNVNVDAALAMMLGADYNSMGHLSEYQNVPLITMQDAIVPGTQNTAPTGVLSDSTVYMMAASRYKPMTIAYNSATPITIAFDPTRTSNFEIGLNVTISLDMVATFASKIAKFTV